MNKRTYKRARSAFGHKLADSAKTPKRVNGNKLGLRTRFVLAGVNTREFNAWYALPTSQHFQPEPPVGVQSAIPSNY